MALVKIFHVTVISTIYDPNNFETIRDMLVHILTHRRGAHENLFP